MGKKFKIIFGLILLISGITLACIWFSWKLVLIIFLLMWANNIDSKIALVNSFQNYTEVLKDAINKNKVK